MILGLNFYKYKGIKINIKKNKDFFLDYSEMLLLLAGAKKLLLFCTSLLLPMLPGFAAAVAKWLLIFAGADG